MRLHLVDVSSFYENIPKQTPDLLNILTFDAKRKLKFNFWELPYEYSIFLCISMDMQLSNYLSGGYFSNTNGDQFSSFLLHIQFSLYLQQC